MSSYFIYFDFILCLSVCLSLLSLLWLLLSLFVCFVSSSSFRLPFHPLLYFCSSALPSPATPPPPTPTPPRNLFRLLFLCLLFFSPFLLSYPVGLLRLSFLLLFIPFWSLPPPPQTPTLLFSSSKIFLVTLIFSFFSPPPSSFTFSPSHPALFFFLIYTRQFYFLDLDIKWHASLKIWSVEEL